MNINLPIPGSIIKTTMMIKDQTYKVSIKDLIDKLPTLDLFQTSNLAPLPLTKKLRLNNNCQLLYHLLLKIMPIKTMQPILRLILTELGIKNLQICRITKIKNVTGSNLMTPLI